MTYLDIVNAVLRRLREDEVASVTADSHTKLIADFVKQALSEVEDAWTWNALRQTIQAVTSSTVFSYALTGAGTSFKILTVHQDDDDYDLEWKPSSTMTHWLLDDNRSNDKPLYYNINGVDSNGDPVVDLYPVPDAVYNVNFNIKVKTDLSTDTSGTTNIMVPWLPVVLRATALAVEERGDDQGMSLQFLMGSFNQALSDAIAVESANFCDETTWVVE